MTKTDSIDVTHKSFTSTVFPTDEDMKLWNALTPNEQRSVINGKVEEGLQGQPAKKASKTDIMAEVLADLKKEL